MYKRAFIVFAALFAGGIALGQAYKWVDEDGIVHYSDRPAPGAEQIQLPTYHRPSGPTTPPTSSTFSRRNEQTAAAAKAPEQPIKYESIAVTSPGPEETLWNIEGVLNVTVALQPALQPGHRIRVYFDGNPQLVDGTSFQLQEVWRGVHNIQVEVIDQSGKLMIRSQPNRFYVQQNAIGR